MSDEVILAFSSLRIFAAAVLVLAVAALELFAEDPCTTEALRLPLAPRTDAGETSAVASALDTRLRTSVSVVAGFAAFGGRLTLGLSLTVSLVLRDARLRSFSGVSAAGALLLRTERDFPAFVLSVLAEATSVAPTFAPRRLVGPTEATEALEARAVRFVVLVVVRSAFAVCAVLARLVLVPPVLAVRRSLTLTATALVVAVFVDAREDVVREARDVARVFLSFADAATRVDFLILVVFALATVAAFAAVPRLAVAVVLVVFVVRFAAAAALRDVVFWEAGGRAVVRELEVRRTTFLMAAPTTVLRVEVFLDFFGVTVFRAFSAVRFVAVLADLAVLAGVFASFAALEVFVVFADFAALVAFVIFAAFAVLAALGAMEREVLRDEVTAPAVRFAPAALRAEALVVVGFRREAFSCAVAFDDFVLVDLPTDLPAARVLLVEATVLVALFAVFLVDFGALGDAADFDALEVLIFVVFKALAVLDTLVALETPALAAFFGDFVDFFEDTLLAFFVAVCGALEALVVLIAVFFALAFARVETPLVVFWAFFAAICVVVPCYS